MRPILITLTLSLSAAVSAQAQQVVLPEGTEVSAALAEDVSTESASIGDIIFLKTTVDVMAGTAVVIPRGTPVKAVVAKVERTGRLGRGGQLNLSIESTTAVDGQRIALRAAHRVAGDGKRGTAAMMGPLGLFVRGSAGVLPAGTTIKAFTTGTVLIGPPPSAVPKAVAADDAPASRASAAVSPPQTPPQTAPQTPPQTAPQTPPQTAPQTTPQTAPPPAPVSTLDLSALTMPDTLARAPASAPASAPAPAPALDSARSADSSAASAVVPPTSPGPASPAAQKAAPAVNAPVEVAVGSLSGIWTAVVGGRQYTVSLIQDGAKVSGSGEMHASSTEPTQQFEVTGFVTPTDAALTFTTPSARAYFNAKRVNASTLEGSFLIPGRTETMAAFSRR